MNSAQPHGQIIKAEFMENLSEEIRTSLNNILILSKMLAENVDDNLTPAQVGHAAAIVSLGNDILSHLQKSESCLPVVGAHK